MKIKLFTRISRFLREKDGTSVVEYSVMLAMIVLLAIAAILSMGNESSEFYDHNAEEIEKAL